MVASVSTFPPGISEIQVFVSYSREERDQAKGIIALIEEAGFRVWWDGLLEAGSVFTSSTEEALEGADAVVVLWSARSAGSHWVRDEASSGRDSGRLVPISIDGTLPPLGFRQFQSIDMSGWKGDACAPEFRAIVAAIAKLVSGDAVPPREMAPSGSVSKQRVPRFGKGAIIGAVAGLAALLGVGGLLIPDMLSGTSDSDGSIAIMPFANLSEDADQAYFSDGLSEELRAVLSNGEGLRVVAQTSSNQFRGELGDPKSIADALGVRYILEGSVRRAGDTVRVSAQLIDGDTGFDSWSETYERNLSDIFAVQTDIAGKVASALTIQLAQDGNAGKARPGGTSDPAAYDAYLRGVSLYELAIDEASDRAAESQFKAAIAADPDYGAAWAALSRVQTTIANSYASDRPLSELYDTAVASARKAVALSPNLAQAHAALGYVLLNGRLDARGAEAAYRQSYSFGAGNGDILHGYATAMTRIGNSAEGKKAIEAAVKLDPLNPATFRTRGVILFAGGDYAGAKAAIGKALELNPEMSGVHKVLGQMAYLEGDFKLAKAEFELEGSTLSRLQGLAMTLPKLGNAAGGVSAMAKLKKDFGDNGLYQQAQVLAQTGKQAEAMAALERAYAAGDSGLVQALNDPLLAPLTDSARFKTLLGRMGFRT